MIVYLMIAVYFLVINLVGFIAMGLDKKYAKRQAWRIPEATLFSFALFGGSIGSIMGMYRFRHKTQKLYFTIGMPAILGLQIFIIVLIILLPRISIRIM